MKLSKEKLYDKIFYPTTNLCYCHSDNAGDRRNTLSHTTTPPTVTVSTIYIGADASIVNDTVAQVVENEVNGTQGLDYMSSSSDSSGFYNLEVVFDIGTDGDMDSVKVQNNVAIANASLPTEVQTTGVTTMRSSSNMDFIVSVYSPKGTYDSIFLKNYAEIYFFDKIKRVPGVGKIMAYNADYSMRIWLYPDKLAAQKLTVQDVREAIEKQNRQAPVGSIGQMPVEQHQEKNTLVGRRADSPVWTNLEI